MRGTNEPTQLERDIAQAIAEALGEPLHGASPGMITAARAALAVQPPAQHPDSVKLREAKDALTEMEASCHYCRPYARAALAKIDAGGEHHDKGRPPAATAPPDLDSDEEAFS